MIIRKHSWWLPNSWDCEHMQQGAARVHEAGLSGWAGPHPQIQDFRQVPLEAHLLKELAPGRSSVLIPIFQLLANPKFSSQCFLMSKLLCGYGREGILNFLRWFALSPIWIIVSYIIIFIPFNWYKRVQWYSLSVLDVNFWRIIVSK